MIKAKLKDVVEAMPSVQALMSASLPVKAAYAVGKLARAMQGEFEDFNKAREKLFKDAGCFLEKAENGMQEWKHLGKKGVDGAADATGDSIVSGIVKQVNEELLEGEVELNALPLDIEAFKEAAVPGNAFYGLDWAMKPEVAPQ